MPEIFEGVRIAVLIPCYNEAGAVGRVVRDFREHLPLAEIYVYDNDSSDDTAAEARAAGALVRREMLRGKGNVVRRMFSEIEADCYLMVDGDDTYDAASATLLVRRLLEDGLDMVVGCREPVDGQESYRPGHVFGNRMLTGLAKYFFGRGFTDMLSGYRAFSRRFVKSFPVLGSGFEIETEITVHALSMSMPAAEVRTPYRERAEGTSSKLNTYRDGIRILNTMLRLFKDHRPMYYFGLAALILVLVAVVLFIPVAVDYVRTGLVPRLPTAVLCTGLTISALLSLTCGFILDSVSRERLETKRLAYLAASREPPR
jgi:glycosyltransferase involved in cell wall biosynthesis